METVVQSLEGLTEEKQELLWPNAYISGPAAFSEPHSPSLQGQGLFSISRYTQSLGTFRIRSVISSCGDKTEGPDCPQCFVLWLFLFPSVKMQPCSHAIKQSVMTIGFHIT